MFKNYIYEKTQKKLSSYAKSKSTEYIMKDGTENTKLGLSCAKLRLN
jgi:hypothetical protein